jgi:hypothetical protein
MKFKIAVVSVLLATTLAGPLFAQPAPNKPKTLKPYPLQTCLVSDEKLGEMGKPFVFTSKDQEVKLCCKSCLKDFNKNPDKYMKKLAEKAAEKSAEKPKTK